MSQGSPLFDCVRRSCALDSQPSSPFMRKPETWQAGPSDEVCVARLTATTFSTVEPHPPAGCDLREVSVRDLRGNPGEPWNQSWRQH